MEDQLGAPLQPVMVVPEQQAQAYTNGLQHPGVQEAEEAIEAMSDDARREERVVVSASGTRRG